MYRNGTIDSHLMYPNKLQSYFGKGPSMALEAVNENKNGVFVSYGREPANNGNKHDFFASNKNHIL